MLKKFGNRLSGWWHKAGVTVSVLLALTVTRLRGRKLAVIHRLIGLGDIIWCLPLATQLKQRDPQTAVMLMVSAPFHRLVSPRRCPEIDYAVGQRPLMDMPLRLLKFLEWRGVKILWPLCWNERGADGEEMHLVEEFQTSTGLPRALMQPTLTVSDSEKTAARRQFAIVSGQFTIVLHTGRTWAVRELKQHIWQEVVDILKREMSCRILHICQPRIVAPALPSFELTGVEKLPLTMSLPEVAALLSVSDLFVGIDSGLLHIAGVVGTPVAGIFGSTKPELRLPVTGKTLGISQKQDCSYCQHYSPLQHWHTGCPHDIKCLRSLSAEYICGEILCFIKRIQN
jgi:ADP-heptose:LPS heptosyltransferase